MARVNYVGACRKPQGKCRTCGEEIAVGMGYKYWDFRYRAKLKLHTDCSPRRSWLTGSEILGTIWDMVDDFEVEGETHEEIAESLRDFAQNFRDDVLECLFQEKLDNMEGAGTGLENTPIYEELQDRMSELESFCDEMESEADDIEHEEDESLNDLRERAMGAVGNCPE